SKSLANERFVSSQIGGQLIHVFLLHITLKHSFLQRDVHSHIAVFGDQIVVVEREQKRIDEKHPVKPLGIEIRSKHHEICQASLNIHFVENTVPVGRTACSFRRLFLVD